MKLTLDDLPESLREVVDLIGLPATLRLVENFGGVIQVYVPRQIEPDHPLATVLGLSTARKLVPRYGADYLRNIPRCALGLRRIRNTEIRRRHRAESAAKLALVFALTERQIWTILSDGDDGQQDKQTALF
ncbi:MAG: Mor transcription activator family protein [Sulfuricaulis sp.]|nr:Mor transcription activator family protein [Sulfuricaulis sp.]